MLWLNILPVVAHVTSTSIIECEGKDDMFARGKALMELAENVTLSKLVWDDKFTEVTVVNLLDILVSIVDDLNGM